MKTIPLSRGLVSIVDDEDYELLSPYKWYAAKGGRHFYAARNARGEVRTTVFMHREIMGAMPDPGLTVDHVDHEATLDNRRANLRWATRRQQLWNRGMQTNNTSGYKGVYLDRRRGTWSARAKHHGRVIYFGFFNSAEEAATARAMGIKSLCVWAERNAA